MGFVTDLCGLAVAAASHFLCSTVCTTLVLWIFFACRDVVGIVGDQLLLFVQGFAFLVRETMVGNIDALCSHASCMLPVLSSSFSVALGKLGWRFP